MVLKLNPRCARPVARARRKLRHRKGNSRRPRIIRTSARRVAMPPSARAPGLAN